MMASAEERAGVYTRASQYFYMGSYDNRAALHNKVMPFVERTSGFLFTPSDVRFQVVFDSEEPPDVLDRGELVSEKLSADMRETDSDILFGEAVTWALVNGCSILKVLPAGFGFRCQAVHPQNFGVLSESTLSLEDQEAVCHVSFPTISRLMAMLDEEGHPRRDEIFQRIMEARQSERDEEEPTYFHQLVVGGLQPVGDFDGNNPAAAGIVNVFPIPSPWRPQRRISKTVRLCELWVKDAETRDWVTLRLIYPDILIYGENERKNLGRVPGRCPFVKVQTKPTPGYFWGRSAVADVQMLQDLTNKRLRDIKVMWDRNAAAPKVFSGFTSVTEEAYYKIISEGGFINDPNPNAKSTSLMEAPPQGYLEELEFIWKMWDEASGFTPVMGGQGEPGVRAGVHAQTLVRTSSPRLIDQAARIERQFTEYAYLCFRLMQDGDPTYYKTESGVQFLLKNLPSNFQVQVDSHSASPAFKEDAMQQAMMLARVGAVGPEEVLHMTHPPNTGYLLSQLKKKERAQAQQAQQQHQEDLARDLAGIGQRRQGGGGGRRGATMHSIAALGFIVATAIASAMAAYLPH